jgi:hypothetical protein
VKTLQYLIVATSVVALNVSAFGASVTAIEGSLSVNTGSGFRNLSGTTEVRAGGSVMAGPGARGEILYSDGCRIPVNPGAVSTVAPVSPCALGADLRVPPTAGYQVTPTPAVDPWLTYGLALGAGIGIGCAIWCSQHGHNTVQLVPVPVSP